MASSPPRALPSAVGDSHRDSAGCRLRQGFARRVFLPGRLLRVRHLPVRLLWLVGSAFVWRYVRGCPINLFFCCHQ